MIYNQNPEVEFAMEAVRRASLLVQLVQAEMISPALTKDDRSPVTVADFASQALVGYMLEQRFPDIPLVAEEDSAELSAQPETLQRVTDFAKNKLPEATPNLVCEWIDRGGGKPDTRFWTLDPIDGTKGFLRGDQYAVALALIDNGEVVIGALGCPNLIDGKHLDPGGPGSLVVAVKGEGTWTTPLRRPGIFDRLWVSSTENPSEARVLRSVESGHTNVSQIDLLADAMGVQADPVRLDSQAKYSVLAAGAGDLLLRLLSDNQPDYREKIWDQAAGSLVLEEAGGRITDLDGNSLDFGEGRTLVNNRGVLASNGRLHEAAIQALRDIGA